MKREWMRKTIFALASFLLGFLFQPGALVADPSRYPEYAQQQLPKGITPEFIYLSQFVDEISRGKKPLIVDVRSSEEYGEAHIKGSVSIPLDEVPKHLAEIPKNRLVVLY